MLINFHIYNKIIIYLVKHSSQVNVFLISMVKCQNQTNML